LGRYGLWEYNHAFQQRDMDFWGIVNLSRIGLIFCLLPVTRMLNNQ
jgi:hypothetical protein